MTSAEAPLAPASMTGYGSGSATIGGITARCDLRSVNHRGFDLRARLPPALQELQGEILALVRAGVGRGHVDAVVEIERGAAASAPFQVDRAKALALRDALRELQTLATDDAQAPTLPPLEPATWLALAMAQPGILEPVATDADRAAQQAAAKAAIAVAITALQASRQREGAHLCADLRAHFATIASLRDAIAASADAAPAAIQARLRAKLRALLVDGSGLDPGRLEAEVALIADRHDIAEELVRLRGHLDAAEAAFAGSEPGRTVGFLVQEMLREANTIGSKANELEVAHRVVAIKVELERVREQVQNLA